MESDVVPDLGLQAQNSADELAPHCFQLADNAYEDMVKTHKDQCFVVSGESGAGKTETVKITVGHIMTLCRAGQLALETKITKLNMILEPFGTCMHIHAYARSPPLAPGTAVAIRNTAAKQGMLLWGPRALVLVWAT